MIRRLARWCELLGGERPFALTSWRRMVVLGLYWALLIFVVYTVIGRTTRFIYVDF